MAHPDAATLVRSPQYLRLLVLAAVVGVPISAVAYWFLVLTAGLGDWLYSGLPELFGLDPAPAWWPLPLLGVAGLMVGLLIRFVPGGGGESPLDGFHPGGGAPAPLPLLGIAAAALVSLGFGAVVGPEAPLIAIGGGLAVATVRLARRDVPAQALAVVAAAGSFAAISALFGSPAQRRLPPHGGRRHRRAHAPAHAAAGTAGLGRRHAGVHRPGFLDRARHLLPGAARPAVLRPADLAQFAWALAVGLAAAVLVAVIRRIAVPLRAPAERRVLVAGRCSGSPSPPWPSATPRSPATT